MRSMLSPTVDSGKAAPRPKRSRRFRRPLAAGALGAAMLVIALPADAHADVLQLLPQNADGLEQSFSPAYDYDTDGCYARPPSAPTAPSTPG